MPGAGTTPQFRWPAVIDSTNDEIRYSDGGGATEADVGDGTFFWRGDGSADDLAVRLDTALTAASAATGGGLTFTVVLGDDGILTITGTGAFVLDFSHANTDADPALYGFAAASYTSAADVITSPNQVGSAFHPEQEYVEDTEDTPLYRSVSTPLMNGRVRTQRWGARTKRAVVLDVLPPRKVFTAEETRTGEAFERFFAHLTTGGRFEFCRDFPTANGNRGTYGTYVPDPDDPQFLNSWPTSLPPGSLRRWDVVLPMQAYVA